MKSVTQRLRRRTLAAAPILALAAVPMLGVGSAAAAVPAGVKGIDVSHWQGSLDWAGQYSAGKRFAYMKATEGTTYTDPTFSTNYTGSLRAGFIRGAYHFARPAASSGATQADFFVNNGGGWSADGKTLPGALDLEDGCAGLSQASMRSWIAAFTTRYKARTGRDAVLYTTTSWWTTCTGNTSEFASTNPLWIARYNGETTPGTLPAGYSYYSFWQYSDTPIDQDTWNGDLAGLQRMALG